MRNSKAVSKLVLIGVPVLVGIVLLAVVLIVFRPFQPTGIETWTVDDDGQADFRTIQEAVNASNAGDAIFVRAGTYYESYIEVTKALTLSGENKSTTIIDGGGMEGAVVAIKTSNVSISGFTIQNPAWLTAGIYIGQASKVIVKDNLITSTTRGSGIEFYRSSNNNVSGNFITPTVRGFRGIELKYSSNNTISNNTILNNEDGIYLEYESSSNTFRDNLIMNNSGYGVYYYSFYGDKPCNNNVLIENIIANNSRSGVRLEYSNNNMILDNIVSNNTEGGILAFHSSGSFVGNTLSINGDYSIVISGTSGNNITKNIISNSEEGIELYESSDNIVKENILSSNQYAIYVWGDANNNSICENTISNNNEGIHIAYSNSNTIYHNNFINNTIHVYSRESTNAWDNGYPSGGNYWSDHACTRNPSDGSHPYVIDANNIDRYPFQDPNGWSSS